MRPSSAALFCLFSVVASLAANPPQESGVSMNFTKAPLGDVLKLYEVLTDRPVQATEQLRRRRVSMNTKAKIPRSEAVKFIESRLGNYGIKIVEQGGNLVALCADKKAD